MKILTLLLLIVVMNSCTYVNHPLIIKSIYSYNDNKCRYNLEGNANVVFIAPCGLYQIGDTLK